MLGRRVCRPSFGVVVRWAFGGDGEGETPGPIPNPEVKPLSADGTARETVWESRTPPDTLYEGPIGNDGAFRIFMVFCGFWCRLCGRRQVVRLVRLPCRGEGRGRPRRQPRGT